MTWAERATDANQMRHSDLKGREGGTRAELDKLWNDNSARSGVTLTFTWNHPQTHTAGSSKQRLRCSSWVLRYFSHSYILYRCLICLWGIVHSYAQSIGVFFIFTCGMMLLETKWILFLCEQCCSELGPGPARGLVQHRSALAWPQSAFLSHAAPDLLTHFLTQEIELTPQPGPWGPTAAYTAVH